MSLRSYLILLAALVVLLISTGTLILVRQLETANRSQAEAQLLATTHALSQAVDGQLDGYHALLLALRQSEALQRRDWAAFDRQARSLLAGDAEAWIVVGDRAGRQLVNTRLPAGTAPPAGPPQAHIWPELDRGRSRVCDLTTGLVVPNIVCVDIPVLEDGRAAYHLSVIFRPAQLRHVIQKQDLSGGKVAVVVDRRGTVIWRSRRAEDFVGRPGPAQALSEVLSRPGGIVRTPNLEGVPTVAAFSRSPRSGWTFVVAVPERQLEPAFASTLRTGLAAFAICVALAAAVAFIAAHRLSRAVGRLTRAAERIRTGGPPDWTGSGFAEIDAVGRTLDRALSERDAADERFELAQEVGGIGAWEWDIVRDEGRVSAAYKRMHGLEAAEGALRMRQVLEVIHPDDLAGYLERLSAATTRPEPSTNEYRVVLGDGAIRWVGAKGRPLFDETGRAVSAVGIVIDLTERKAAEARLGLLMREVDHRANNLMAVVQSAVTLSRGADVESLRDNIIGRVNALARAHQLLAASRWQGADLVTVLEEELGPYTLGEPERIDLDGEPVSLSPTAIQGVAMVIHELATNAAKYGALSVPGGRVRVAWRREGGRLRLTWTETGGPPVEAPQRRGFGATVIARALGGPVGGQTVLHWRADGVVCELELPVGAQDADQTTSATDAPVVVAG